MNTKMFLFILLLSISVCAQSTDFENVDDKCKDFLSNATMYYYSGDFQSAINKLEDGIEQYPEFEPFYVFRGIFYEEKGHYDKAIEYYSEGIDLFDSFIIYWRRFLLYNKLNQKKDAFSDWEKIKCLTIDESSDDFSLRVLLYIHYHNYEKALEEINKVIRIKESASDLMIRSRIQYEKQNITNALNDAIKATKIRLESEKFALVSDYLWISILFYKNGDFDKSTNYLSRAITVHIINQKNEKKRMKKEKIVIPTPSYNGSLDLIDIHELIEYGDFIELDGKFSDKNVEIIKKIFNLLKNSN